MSVVTSSNQNLASFRLYGCVSGVHVPWAHGALLCVHAGPARALVRQLQRLILLRRKGIAVKKASISATPRARMLPQEEIESILEQAPMPVYVIHDRITEVYLELPPHRRALLLVAAERLLAGLTLDGK